MILQREIPEFVNIIGSKIAKEKGAKVILDVGGADTPITDDLLKNIDIISPNEVLFLSVYKNRLN